MEFNISYIKGLSGYEIIKYLISVYENSDGYFRSIALGLEDFEFSTSPEIYSLYGIDGIYYTQSMDKIVLSGNTDIFINFPTLLRYSLGEKTYMFKIHSLGSKLLSDINPNYMFKSDTPTYFFEGELDESLLLYYDFDYSYLTTLISLTEFDSGVLENFYLSNIDLIKTNYKHTESSLSMSSLLKLLNILSSNSDIKSILKTKDLFLEIDSDYASFYTDDLSNYVYLNKLFHSISLGLNSFIVDIISAHIEDFKLIKYFFISLKSLGIQLLIEDYGLLELLELMLSMGKVTSVRDSEN